MKFCFAANSSNLALQDRKTSREQRGALFQSSKRNADSSGSLNRCAIQYEVSVCASHLPKHSHLVSATVDETFKLSDPLSVRNERNPYSAIAPLFCPRKTPYFKVFARPFSKGRVLPAYSPRTPRVPRASPQVCIVFHITTDCYKTKFYLLPYFPINHGHFRL